MGKKVGKLQQLKPQMLECFIANTIRNNAPRLYDQINDEGLVLEWLPSAWVAADAAETVMSFKITSSEEAQQFQCLSDAVGKLITYCERESETLIAASLRYIKADVDVELFRFFDERQPVQASG